MASRKRSISNEAEIRALHKEWDELSCSICMDHPHNAVLLLCSSHEKGCRSYICDTSYRHSNCLDRFKALRAETSNSHPLPGSSPSRQQNTSGGTLVSRTTADSIEAHGNGSLSESEHITSTELAGGLGETSIQDADRPLEVRGEGNLETGDSEILTVGGNSPELKLNLICPLCRGTVQGWKVVEEARKYLNLKSRSCSCESCSFFGNYEELRRHARRTHPTTRPADVDPSRQRAWRRLVHQREYADIVSVIREAMPGAVVLGDYIIENGDRVPAGRERTMGSGEPNGPLWTTFLLFQMIGSMDPDTETRVRSRAWSRHRRSGGAFSRRQFWWGELGLQDDGDEDVIDEDEDEDDSFPNISNNHDEDGSPIPRRRRRLTRSSTSDEDQS